MPRLFPNFQTPYHSIILMLPGGLHRSGECSEHSKSSSLQCWPIQATNQGGHTSTFIHVILTNWWKNEQQTKSNIYCVADRKIWDYFKYYIKSIAIFFIKNQNLICPINKTSCISVFSNNSIGIVSLLPVCLFKKTDDESDTLERNTKWQVRWDNNSWIKCEELIDSYIPHIILQFKMRINSIGRLLNRGFQKWKPCRSIIIITVIVASTIWPKSLQNHGQEDRQRLQTNCGPLIRRLAGSILLRHPKVPSHLPCLDPRDSIAL